MVHLTSAALLLLAPIHVINAGSLTFLKSTKLHQQDERQVRGHMGRHMGRRNRMGMGHARKNERVHERQQREHRGECWEHRPVHKSFIQQTPHSMQEPQLALPGAGLHPDNIQPFQTVTKDGFLLSACVKDAMLEHGDKFGNGKHRYKMEASNVSIVHYAEIIPKEDREHMTINRCFDFCRTVPNMVYFGLNNGRDCYCTPFYKPMAGDSSNCDQTCEGDPSQMCGGKTMSSIFEMHSCDDTQSVLQTTITDVEDIIFLHLQDLADHVKNVADEGLYDATEMQEVFGLAGGPDVSNYMQEAKVYSGELLKPAQEAFALIDSMQDPYDAATMSLSRNLRDFDNIKVAEDAVKLLKEGIEAAKPLTHTMRQEMKKAHPTSVIGQQDYNSTDAALQYYPIMYFVEEKSRVQYAEEKLAMFQHPTTCTGNLLQIVFGGIADDCAEACDALPGKCDGFQYLAFNDGMCFLFESIKTVQQWTGCTQDEPAPFMAECMGKLSRLESVGGIAPREEKVLEEAQKVRQGTGKCAHCLDKFEVSDRCYEYGAKCLGNKYDMDLWYEWAVDYYGWGSTGYDTACERIATEWPGGCIWEYGRPGYYDGTGQYLQAAQVCPQCGYCIDNGRQSGDPNPWLNEHWDGDPIHYYY